jgi:hypothetical protein
MAQCLEYLRLRVVPAWRANSGAAVVPATPTSKRRFVRFSGVMRVACAVEEVELEGDHGQVPGVCVTCSRCDHETESFGTSPRSVRRCLVLMREECPLGEENYYAAEEAEDDE